MAHYDQTFRKDMNNLLVINNKEIISWTDFAL